MLQPAQINQFKEKGFLILEQLLNKSQLDEINQSVTEMEDMSGAEFFREKDSEKLRTVFSPETFSPQINLLLEDSELTGIVDQLIGEPFYLFQSKLNIKASLASGVWTWHQDFKFWKEDGMIAPKALTVAIFLSDVSIASGPLLAIPSSHKEAEVATRLNNPDGVHDENLKYVINPGVLKEMVGKYGEIIPLTGKAGDAAIFHSNILHGSYQNMHFEDRKLLMFTFNPVNNIKSDLADPRPEYMVKRKFKTLN